MILEVNQLYKEYEDSEILKDVHLQLQNGEFVAIMGQSGCGKSTLLYCVSGMDRPTKGEIIFGEKKLTELSERELERFRLIKMGFVFQKPNFLKNLSVQDNIMFPALQAKKAIYTGKQEVRMEAERLMQKMDILHVAKHDIRKVSGGQLQRAAICRALINHPQILFGDEPTGALNSSATREVMDILNQINEEGTAILLVTHDAKVAARADRVIYLEDGCVKAELGLGKYTKESIAEREEKLKLWLERMGF